MRSPELANPLIINATRLDALVRQNAVCLGERKVAILAGEKNPFLCSKVSPPASVPTSSRPSSRWVTGMESSWPTLTFPATVIRVPVFYAPMAAKNAGEIETGLEWITDVVEPISRSSVWQKGT